MIIGLLVGAYVARHLGPESFGVLSYVISLVFLFSGLARLGLDNMIVRDLVAHSEHEAEILGSALVLRLTGGTLAVSLIAAVAWNVQTDPTTRLAILIIAFGLIFQSLEVSAYWFHARTFARPVALARLAALSITSALRIALILLDKPILWFAVPVALDTALAAVLMLVFYLRDPAAPALLRFPAGLGRVGTMLRETWPLALSTVLVEIQLRIDQVMLGQMLGPQEVGWYASAARISQMLYFLPTLIATATFPAIVRAQKTSRELYDQRMQAFYDVMLWLGVGIALPGAVLASPAIHLLYGEAYAPAATILQIHIWSLVFVSLGTARSRWLVAEGLNRTMLITSLVGVTANVGCNAMLIPSYGGPGAAWATLFAQLTSLLIVSLAYPPMRHVGMMIAVAVFAPLRYRC
jgi:O-antigen/teichoic acid export membrane protein